MARTQRSRAHPADGSPGICRTCSPRRRIQARDRRRIATQETGNGHHGPFGKKINESPYDLADPVVQLERQVLQLAVQRPGLCGPEFDALGAGRVHRAGAPGGVHADRRVRRHGGWRRQPAGNGPPGCSEEAPNDRAQAFVTGFAVEPLVITGEPDAKYADMTLARVGEIAVSRRDHGGQGPAAAHESGGRAG